MVKLEIDSYYYDTLTKQILLYNGHYTFIGKDYHTVFYGNIIYMNFDRTYINDNLVYLGSNLAKELYGIEKEDFGGFRL